MILAELTAHIAQRLQRFGHRHVFGMQTEVRAWKPYLRESGTDRRLPRDEGCPSGCAALLAIPIGEEGTFLGDAVDVWRAIPHDPKIIGAHVEPTDVVGHDHKDIRLAS